MYGAVICSRCRKAMAVDLRNKTATCQCGNVLNLGETKKFFESSNQREVGGAVARINAELEGGLEEWESASKKPEGERADPLTRTIAAASSVTDVQERLEIVAKGLTSAYGSFTKDQLGRALRALGIKNVEECVDMLLKESIIYEPSEGVYRAV